MAVAGAAAAQTPYPAAVDRETVGAWLQQAAGLAPDQVVALSSSTATAMVASSRAAGGVREVVLRAVALTRKLRLAAAVAAWDMKLEVDCRSGQVRLGATTGYADRRPDGDGVPLAPAESEWRRPRPGTVLEAAWQAACVASFRPPLTGARLRVAEASQAPSVPATPAARTPPAAQAAPSYAREAVAKAPARSGGVAAVQVVSSPQEADTRRALRALQEDGALQGLQPRVEPARVRGQTVYRGVIAGFASRSDAQAFCTSLKSRGQDCLMR